MALTLRYDPVIVLVCTQGLARVLQGVALSRGRDQAKSNNLNIMSGTRRRNWRPPIWRADAGIPPPKKVDYPREKAALSSPAAA